ncbi:MAG: alpha/beta hydrolase [Actinomycetota bacterium]|nr:alpha/beta hydrolase [Actinomycetota bacterium]
MTGSTAGRSTPRAWLAGLVSVAVLAFGACGTKPAVQTPTGPQHSTSVPVSYARQCAATGKEARALNRAPNQTWSVSDGHGSTMPVAVVGSGGTMVVLLHQISGGACGWASFVAGGSASARYRFVVPDLCGSGESRCKDAFDLDQVAQARLIVQRARARFHPRRLTLVGASMGGAIALHAVATGLRVDGVADLSGPDGFLNGARIATDVRRLHVPALLMFDHADDQFSFDAARAAARAGGRTMFVASHGGHGWEMVSDGTTTLRPEGHRLLGFAATGR